MAKLMTLDVLSSIKGAEASEAVNNLFDIIRKANSLPKSASTTVLSGVPIDELREDIVIICDPAVQAIIRGNFPKSKNGYLVVPKVIED